MVHGAAEVSMREVDPRRYGGFAGRNYVISKVCEDYLLRHETPWPHFNRLAARPVRTSPLYRRLHAAGAVHEEVSGWERPRGFARDGMPQRDLYSFRRPGWHEAVAREVEAVRERAGIMDISAFAMNAMRMEKMFKGASELTNEATLPEAGAMRFARLDKPGGFLGREATRRSLEAGEGRWRCAYLEVDAGDADCLGGEAVFDGHERVGAVSSGAWGPSVGASLAFAYLTPERALPGTALEVSVLDERRPARVLGAAKHDPGNLRPRA